MIFRLLSKALVAMTGHGYDRVDGTNVLHHKLSYRLFKLAPSFGVPEIQRITFASPVPFSLYYNARDGGVGHKFLIYGEYEPNMTRAVAAIAKPGTHIWNIGANLGYYSVLLAKLVGERGSVTAFEPHPVNLVMLRKNIELNRLQNVAVVDAALSETTGSLSFYESESNSGDHRLASEDGRRSITVRSLASSEALSQFEAPELIVMDVQGAEGVILRSMKDWIARARPMILMEFWPDGLSQLGSSATEVEYILHSLEYQVWRIDESREALLRVETGKIARSMKRGEETNLLCLPKGSALPRELARFGEKG